MIPPVIGDDTASPGEREIFRRLRDEPQSEDWIVLHSLLISDHPKQVSGEADFVVIIPNLGVAILEVKACRSLRVEEGIWYYGWEAGDSRGPFRQASQAMHAIRRFVVEERPNLSGVVFWSAVVFPYVDFAIRSEEWHSWQVIDGRRFRKSALSRSLEEVLQRARDHLAQSGTARWLHDQPSPSITEADGIAALLRPQFEVIEAPYVRRRRVAHELKAYTEDQYEALDAMTANSRVLFSGPAGTGKSLLALEAGRRSARAGERTLFLCFNRALMLWLRTQLDHSLTNITIETMATFMLKVARLDIRGKNPPPDFWQTDLPELAMKALVARSEDPPFHDLILDEAQDLLIDNYLDVLDLSLRAGLAAGRWRFFGDFEKQAIFESDVSYQTFLRQRGNDATIHFLRTNCRNTPRIAALTYQLGGLRPDYRRIRRPDNGIEPELLFFRTDEEQMDLLSAGLEKALRKGYSPNEIVVLSPLVDSAASRLGPLWKDRLTSLEDSISGKIRFTTIAAFKGLEASLVFVTDLAELEGLRAQALFYVACTRPVESLTLLMREPLKASVARLLSELKERATK